MERMSAAIVVEHCTSFAGNGASRFGPAASNGAPCFYSREYGCISITGSLGNTLDDAGSWYLVEPKFDKDLCFSLDSGKGAYKAEAISPILPAKCKFDTAEVHSRVDGRKSTRRMVKFTERGIIAEVKPNYMLIWSCSLGLVIHYTTEKNLEQIFDPMQPVEFKAINCIDNRFIGFVALSVTPVDRFHSRHLRFCVAAEVIPCEGRLIAQCRNGFSDKPDRVVLLDADRSLLKPSADINEGSYVKVAYYRIEAPSGPVFVSAFVTTDEFYDDVFKTLRATRRMSQSEYFSTRKDSSKFGDKFSVFQWKEIMQQTIKPWDVNSDNLEWYGDAGNLSSSESESTDVECVAAEPVKEEHEVDLAQLGAIGQDVADDEPASADDTLIAPISDALSPVDDESVLDTMRSIQDDTGTLYYSDLELDMSSIEDEEEETDLTIAENIQKDIVDPPILCKTAELSVENKQSQRNGSVPLRFPSGSSNEDASQLRGSSTSPAELFVEDVRIINSDDENPPEVVSESAVTLIESGAPPTEGGHQQEMLSEDERHLIGRELREEFTRWSRDLAASSRVVEIISKSPTPQNREEERRDVRPTMEYSPAPTHSHADVSTEPTRSQTSLASERESGQGVSPLAQPPTEKWQVNAALPPRLPHESPDAYLDRVMRQVDTEESARTRFLFTLLVDAPEARKLVAAENRYLHVLLCSLRTVPEEIPAPVAIRAAGIRVDGQMHGILGRLNVERIVIAHLKESSLWSRLQVDEMVMA